MELFAVELRKLVYVVICFQCLLQLTEGSAYQKYLKLFSYLLTMCICCNLIFSFAGNMEASFYEADKLYLKWEQEWRKMTEADAIDEGEAYYEQELWGDKILNEAYKEYDSRNGGEANEGEVSGQIEQDSGQWKQQTAEGNTADSFSERNPDFRDFTAGQ